MTSSSNDPVIGVDIGGTKIAAGLVDRTGKILTQIRRPMVANADAEAGFKALTSAIDALIAQASTELSTKHATHAIGLCAPGPVDPFQGVVVNPPNLPCWRNFPLAARIADRYKVPVKLDNDANAAALAETRWGAARGYRYVFYVTLGTGIGSGIVLDNRIYLGRTGAAGEGGHVSIDYRGPRCPCGKLGCIEVLAAGPAIGARARAKLSAQQTPRSAMLDLAQGKIEAVTSEIVGQAYVAKDPLAHEVLQETVELLTAWLGNIIDLFDPDVIVMGGGVAAMLQPFFTEINRLLPSRCVNSRCQEIPLLLAHYKADAGVAGGAALCSETAV